MPEEDRQVAVLRPFYNKEGETFYEVVSVNENDVGEDDELLRGEKESVQKSQFVISRSDFVRLLQGEELMYGPLKRRISIQDGPFEIVEDGSAPHKIMPPDPIEYRNEPESSSIRYVYAQIEKEMDQDDPTLNERIEKALQKFVARVRDVFRGGPGSGHHGHEGRPGEVGGSLPEGVSADIGATAMTVDTSEGYYDENKDWKFKDVTRELRLCKIGRGKHTHYAIGKGDENKVMPNSASCGQSVRSYLRDMGGLKSADQVTCDKCSVKLQKIIDKGRVKMPIEPSDLSIDQIKQITGEMRAWDFADMVLSRQWNYYELRRGGKEWRNARGEWLANEQYWKRDIPSDEAEAWIDALPDYDRSIIAHDLEAMQISIMESMSDDEVLDHLQNTRGFNRAINELRERSYVERGGAGSGHHGHAGRPGEVGGSAPSTYAVGDRVHFGQLGDDGKVYHVPATVTGISAKDDKLTYDLELNPEDDIHGLGGEYWGYERDIQPAENWPELPPRGNAWLGKEKGDEVHNPWGWSLGHFSGVHIEHIGDLPEGSEGHPQILDPKSTAARGMYGWQEGETPMVLIYADSYYKTDRETISHVVENLYDILDHAGHEGPLPVVAMSYDAGHSYRVVKPEEWMSIMVERKSNIKVVVRGPLRRIYIEEGGPGSGHHGHKGRPGEKGGSLPLEEAIDTEPGLQEAISERDPRKVVEIERKRKAKERRKARRKAVEEALERRGGEGSGHHGHKGVPGEVGGSAPGTGGAGAPRPKRVGVREEQLAAAQEEGPTEEKKDEEERAVRELPMDHEVYPPVDANGNVVAFGYEPANQNFTWNDSLDTIGQIPLEDKMAFMKSLPHDTREMTADQRWDLAKMMLDMPAEDLFQFQASLSDKPNIRGTTEGTSEYNHALRLTGMRDVVNGAAQYLSQIQKGAMDLEADDPQQQAFGRSLITSATRDLEFDVMGVWHWGEDDAKGYRESWSATLSFDQPTEEKSLVGRGGKGSGHAGHKGRKGEVGGSEPGDGGRAGDETSVAEAKSPEVASVTIKVGENDIQFDSQEQYEMIKGMAQDLHAEGLAREAELSKMMSDLASEHGGDMSGLEYAVKSENRTIEKIREKMREDDLSEEEAAARINDVNRYTMLFSPEEYVEKVKAVQKQLGAQGYVQYDTKYKNYWGPGDDYDGYNTVITNPDTGERVELQFHTYESIRIKRRSHKLYEQLRVIPESQPGVRKGVYADMNVLWSQDYPKPENWEQLEGVVK